MNTYGATVSKGVRVTDADVAKGLNLDGLKGLFKVKKPPAPPMPKPYNPVSNVRPGGRMYGNVHGVGKGLGVQPVLARRTPAAGRGGRRLLTGDAVNVRRVIGKAEPVEKFSFGGIEQITHGLKGIRSGLTSGWKAGRTGGAIAQGGPLAKPFMAAQKVGQAAGQRPAATGALAGGLGTAAVLGGNGHRNRRDAMYAPSYASGPIFGKADDGFVNIDYRDRDGRPVGKFRVRRPAAAQKMRDQIGKRSYDPEGERRWRQGAAAAGTGIAGVGFGASGVRGIRRDTKNLRSSANQLDNPRMPKTFVPRGAVRVDDPSGAKYRTGPNKGKPKKVEVKPTALHRAEDSLKATQNARERAHAAGQLGHLRAVRNPGGALVRGRQAGKLGAGLALLGVSGALNRHRHEERWD